MQNRAQKYNRERRTEALREELGSILAGELGDPRIGLVTVTDLLMGEGGKSARVFVTVVGDEKEARESIEGLQSASKFIRHELQENLGLRFAPEISFYLDKSQEYGSRIDDLLHRVDKRTKKIRKRDEPEQQ